jgi:CMP/dCMP kinase
VDLTSLTSTIITLDGLAASGKSSVAKGIATTLNIPFISSGLLYRLVAFTALETNTEATSQTALLEMLNTQELRFEAQVSGNSVYLNNTEVTNQCHSSRVDTLVSAVAQHPEIRAWVNSKIRLLEPPFVAEGRDMGTNVFPNASIKIFLTASSLVRAKRRVTERNKTLEEIQTSIENRDMMDAINSTPASDAVVLDSSNLNLEQTIAKALEYIQK